MDGTFEETGRARVFHPDTTAKRPDKPFQPSPGMTVSAGRGRFAARSARDMAVTVGPELPVPIDRLTPEATLADLLDAQAQAQAAAGAPAAPPPPPRPASPEELARAHAAGIVEGQAMARREMAAQFSAEHANQSQIIRALGAALQQLATPPAEVTDALGSALEQVVARLASERAGQVIDASPAPFARRIARLADRVIRDGSGLVVRLSPDDHAAILPLIAQECPPDIAVLAEARLVADGALSRGDVALRLPGINLSDLITPAAVTVQTGKSAA